MTKETESAPNITLRLDNNILMRADAICERLAALPARLQMTRAGVLKSAVLAGLDLLEEREFGAVRQLSDAERASLDAAIDNVATVMSCGDLVKADENLRGRVAEALLWFRLAVLTGRN